MTSFTVAESDNGFSVVARITSSTLAESFNTLIVLARRTSFTVAESNNCLPGITTILSSTVAESDSIFIFVIFSMSFTLAVSLTKLLGDFTRISSTVARSSCSIIPMVVISSLADTESVNCLIVVIFSMSFTLVVSFITKLAGAFTRISSTAARSSRTVIPIVMISSLDDTVSLIALTIVGLIMSAAFAESVIFFT